MRLNAGFLSISLVCLLGCDVENDLREVQKTASRTEKQVREIEDQIADLAEMSQAQIDRLRQNNMQVRQLAFENMRVTRDLKRKIQFAGELNRNYEYQLLSGRELSTDPKVDKILAADLREFFNIWQTFEVRTKPFPVRLFGADADYDNLLAIALTAHEIRLGSSDLAANQHPLTGFTAPELIGQALSRLSELRENHIQGQRVPAWKMVVAENSTAAQHFLEIRFAALVQATLERALPPEANLFHMALHNWPLDLSHLEPLQATMITRDYALHAARTLHFLQELGIQKPHLAAIESLSSTYSEGAWGYIVDSSVEGWQTVTRNLDEIFFSDRPSWGFTAFHRLWGCRLLDWSFIWDQLEFCQYQGSVGLAELLAHMSVSDTESYDNSDLSVLLEPTPDEKRLLRSALNLLREPYVKK